MKFRTEVPIKKPSLELNHLDGMMFIGSCFSENISTYLERYRFRVHNGAHGILFHPIPIFNALSRLIHGEGLSQAELIQSAHGWVSLAHHGSYRHSEPHQLQARIQNELESGHRFLSNSKLLVITFGTAMGYVHKDTKSIVANCHRLPQQDFWKELSNLEALMETAKRTLTALFHFNPEIKVVFTVSPVRHLREGFVENQRSKARLLLLCELLQEHFEAVDYFPSYEIQLDELRDYRFYTEDMVHPNAQAVRFIAEKFESYVLSEKARALNKEMNAFLSQLEHRPLHDSSELVEKRKAEFESQIRLILEKGYED